MDWDGDIIVDRFRAAAMGMCRWADALDELARCHGGRFGQMNIWGEGGGALLNIVSGTSPEEDALYLHHGGLDPDRNPRTRAFLRTNMPFRSITEEDFTVPGEVRRTAIYADVFDPLDVPHVSMVRLSTDAQPVMGLAVLRPRSRGHADADDRSRLNATAPAIGAILQASLRLGTLQNDVLVRTAEQLSGPAIVLGCDRAIRSLSPAAEAVVRRGEHLSVRRGRLIASTSRGAAALDAAFRQACAAPSLAADGSASLPSRVSGQPLAINLSPLPTAADGPIGLGLALLTICLPRVRPAGAAQLRAAFGLTVAEAKVAVLLGDGHDLAAIAARRGTAIGTVRNQVKALLEKTGTHRQAELVLRLRLSE